MSDVRYPAMRSEIVSAVEALADPEYQSSAWVRGELPPGTYDDFTLCIHILYDDTRVLEDPDGTIGDLLKSQGEADAMRKLAAAIDKLLDDLGTELPDEDYLRAPGWSDVVTAASEALRALAE